MCLPEVKRYDRWGQTTSNRQIACVVGRRQIIAEEICRNTSSDLPGIGTHETRDRHRDRVPAHPQQRLDVLLLSHLPGGAVSNADKGAGSGFRLLVEPVFRHFLQLPYLVLSQPVWEHRRVRLYYRQHGCDRGHATGVRTQNQ